jgi:predicted transcriptional regulator
MEKMTSECQSNETLTEWYKKLPRTVQPKTDFVSTIAKECGIGEQAVRLWVRGESKPSNPAHAEILSKRTGIPVEKLFKQND